MKKTDVICDDFFIGIPHIIPAMDEEKLSIEFADISDIMSEAFFVLDFQKRTILHAPQHYLSLCGYTPEMIEKKGYKFFKELLHPKDLTLWKDIHVTILKTLYSDELPKEKIKFFGCTLRIKSFLSEENNNPEYLMVYFKIKPKWMHGIPRWGICLLSVAVVPKSGNLCVYYKDHGYSTYSFISGKWTLHPFVPLSKREKQILIWSQGGLSNKEIADRLCLSVKVVEKNKSSLFEEWNVDEELKLNSINKKLQYANNRCLIYQTPVKESKKAGKKQIPPHYKIIFETYCMNKKLFFKKITPM